MRILITGGAGCLGSNLIEHWIPAGHEVLSIDNYETGKREVLPDISGLTVVDGSITNADLVDECFSAFRPTHVVHSAAAYKDPTNWQNDSNTNVCGAINIAKACLKYKVARLLNFQTALVYGIPQIIPIPVSHPTAPFTSYGISKLCGENYLGMVAVEIPFVSLRLANVTGPRLAIGPIPTFYTRLKEGKGCFCSDTIRDFLDMNDFISIVDLVLADDATSGIFNVSTGVGSSIKEVFDEVVRYLGVVLDEPVPIVPPGADDSAAVVLDPSETIKKFNWNAQYDFESTITRMLTWYDKHGVTDIFSHLAAPK